MGEGDSCLRVVDDVDEASALGLFSIGYRVAGRDSDGLSEGRLSVREVDCGCEFCKGTVY